MISLSLDDRTTISPTELAFPNNQEKSGPFVEEIVYDFTHSDTESIVALQDGEIDMIGDMIDPTFVAELTDAEDIELRISPGNGYGYIVINCRKYPLNITAFRRALAYALDKHAICAEVWDGLAQPLDCCIPEINPFSAEDELSYHYYQGKVELGNQILDEAGFHDIDNDTFREAPNTEDFEVLVEASDSSSISADTVTLVASALQDLAVNATSSSTWYNLPSPYWKDDYDIVFLNEMFDDFDVDWLAHEYWSEYADEPYWNSPGFKNATYDSWRNQLLHSPSHREVLEAAIEMQKILAYQSPIIVCYQALQVSAHRTDRFEGFKKDPIEGVHGFWTNYKIRLRKNQGGPFGGAFTWSNSLDPDTFNFMVTSSSYTMDILDMLYDSLITRDWEGEDIGWLAEEYRIEMHGDNPSVPVGYTRITFDLISNASWSDGEKLTAEDVAFTLNYYQQSPGNPLAMDLKNMTAAFAKTEKSVVVEFNTESYWHLHSVGYKPIIPQHIFSEIGLNGWNTWDPMPPEEAMVTSGPFNVSDYSPGEYCTIGQNPNYFYSARDMGPSISQPEDVHCDVFHSPVSITWHLADIDPYEYQIMFDGRVVKSEDWTSPNYSLTFPIGNLAPGCHNLTIVASDSIGNLNSDTVFIFVEGPIATILTVTSIGIIGVCIAIVIRFAYQEMQENTSLNRKQELRNRTILLLMHQS
ncbi:MAG: hypothetical protein GF309_06545 [Candidatus Lokiarchaeota archaeon]|nr:hypothetical protein [Candidatus Lokiarchaeota archaeon]